MDAVFRTMMHAFTAVPPSFEGTNADSLVHTHTDSRPEEEEQQPSARRNTPYKWVNNLRPLLWRRMCAALAEKLARVNDGSSRVARMERTVYAGAFCICIGPWEHVNALLPIP